MKILFLDESGDHNLTILDENYPVFVLSGCIMDEKHHNTVLSPKIFSFKKEIFHSSKIILHYVDYTRNQHGFEKMIEKNFRDKFYTKLNHIIKETDFTLISAIIDKKEHNKKYGYRAIDPYLLSLEVIVERFIFFLQQTQDKGVIIAESRGNQLDNELELSFLDLKINGTKFLRPKEITDKIENFMIKKKKENIAGLQLVDAVVTPVGRKYLKRKNYYLNYDVIKSKFRKNKCGKYKGFGLVILPVKEKRATPATQ
ncbi:DUF3800 domain-containing protein [Candidatus Auribacterota bacterium]